MPPHPEEAARHAIDQLLSAAGWVIQDRDGFNRNASTGVAVREFQLRKGPCDYLLFVDGKAAGVIEAKPAGTTLSGVAEQSERYMDTVPDHVAQWNSRLPFAYESTADETLFRDRRDPRPRSRNIFAFHKPETLLEWLQNDTTLRARLAAMPPLDHTGLRDCQIEAIEGLERSLADDKPRSLIQMATGAGKTFTACTFSWRLLKYAEAGRILFLVDRNNLGDQTLKEYQNYLAPGAAHRFTNTYIVQHLSSNKLDPDAQVVITTIQRLYAMLKGEELAEDAEETSSFETWDGEQGDIRPVPYSPRIPIETFDFIVIDECHRSIYGIWRQVLEYFDAYLLGLTATPSKHTLGFFHSNLVAEYPYEQSVADGVNVGYEVFRIDTQVTSKGGSVDAGFHVPVRDRRTRAIRYRELDDALEYTGQQLDRSVTVPNQIRAVLRCYRDNLFTELFPGRSGHWVPKTLIFAKDDNHAEEIVTLVREVFNEGNEFAKKITYQTSEKPKELIKAFRVDPFPRIAVTVDMIATGTDIKPVECVIFMRDVKSEGYYEQMKGRGVRTIRDADLHQVTPDAKTKTRFVLIDAVGVTETQKSASQPLERKRSLAFDKLLEQIAQGRRDDDAVSSLSARLAALDQQIDDEDRSRISQATDGRTLKQLAHGLLNAIDPDYQQAQVLERHGETATDAQAEQVAEALKDEACTPFDDAEVRKTLVAIKKKTDIVIDEWTSDSVVIAEYDMGQAQERVTSFKDFIEANKNELLALQILYSQPYGKQRLTYAAVKELAQKLTDPPHHLTTADVWQAYKRLHTTLVRGAPSDKVLTDIISLVRFATGQTDVLEPYDVGVRQRFNLWAGRQKKAGRQFTQEQMSWLEAIRDYLAANVEIEPADLMRDQPFSDWGGVVAAKDVFGAELKPMLDELGEVLAA
ncbi:DEAD/DEAH box helicase family protein [Spectribacter hydrogenooxidans]|uniref:Type I restriction-modification enzyme R subunit C-terminal domain-containing protein n=1 Tax=Spectribacter hydrogenoxidans TaxID=3075608 RepID=A0ABU3BY15_9GAMM|nr:DEAD/DEAH box helicase family protein [Salinisphaera sp. W335]MDT0634215.1 type I restriction-modification enzyme R subunit C-terminal domain-containing protein [Salinisphaera sp. W335]